MELAELPADLARTIFDVSKVTLLPRGVAQRRRTGTHWPGLRIYARMTRSQWNQLLGMLDPFIFPMPTGEKRRVSVVIGDSRYPDFWPVVQQQTFSSERREELLVQFHLYELDGRASGIQEAT